MVGKEVPVNSGGGKEWSPIIPGPLGKVKMLDGSQQRSDKDLS